MTFEVAKRKCKNSIGKMLSIERALVKKTLLNWFNLKTKPSFDRINPIAKVRYESHSSINWKKDKCVICKFLLKTQPTTQPILKPQMMKCLLEIL